MYNPLVIEGSIKLAYASLLVLFVITISACGGGSSTEPSSTDSPSRVGTPKIIRSCS